MSKIFEKIILQIFTQKNSYPKSLMSSLGSGHGTVQIVAMILQDAKSMLNMEQNTVMLSLDIQRAFDTGWHDGLIHKLFFTHEFPLYLITLIHSYLSNRSLCVKVENELSVIKLILWSRIMTTNSLL